MLEIRPFMTGLVSKPFRGVALLRSTSPTDFNRHLSRGGGKRL